MLNSSALDFFALTLDIDWAPDCVLAEIADILVSKQVKATWFVTHDSPGVRSLLQQNHLFEFGLHPNFLAHSSQGKDEREVMQFMRSILPAAKSMRTHALVQSSHLLALAVNEFEVETDVSLFLPETANLQPHTIYFNHQGKGLLRIPYFWEDDSEMYHPHKTWDFSAPKFHAHGLKILNFHPLFIYLNADTIHSYEALKKLKSLTALQPQDIEPYINLDQSGVRTLFTTFIDHLRMQQQQMLTISEIAQQWQAGLDVSSTAVS